MLTLTSVGQGLGLAGLFATRVFLPLFAAALILRYGHAIGWAQGLGLLASVDADTAPTWFTHDSTLIILGLLSAAELLAHKSADARALLNAVDQYAKPIAAGLAYVGIASVADIEFVEQHLAQAGFGTFMMVPLIVAATYFVASAHNFVLGSMMEVDDGDDTGLLRIFSWGQDLWAAFGIVFLILFPIVMIILIGIAIGIILLLRKRAAIKEERSKIACANCQHAMYRSAMACANCGTANPAPTRLNWLGSSTMTPTHDLASHPTKLASHRRCRKCATRLRERSPRQTCPACRTVTFDNHEFVTAYHRMMSNRLPVVLIICLLLSMIPIIGLVPGVIYYRLSLVAPYRRYVSRGRSFFLRWFVHIIALLLIMIQWMPGLGMITIPLMALIAHSTFRGAFERQLHSTANAASSVVTPPATA